MKRLFIIISILIAAVILLIPGECASQAMGPLYPGSFDTKKEKKIVIEGVAEPRVYKIYYSKDAYKKVLQYYARKMGKKVRESHSREEDFDGPKGSPLEYSAVKITNPASGLTEADLLDPLKKEVGAGIGGVTKTSHTWEDIEKVKQKYGYLASEAFFPNFSPQEKLAACGKKTGSGVKTAAEDHKALQDKAQELAKQGRYKEMQQLLAGLQGAASNTTTAISESHWDEWISCLKELDSKAYRAEIMLRVK